MIYKIPTHTTIEIHAGTKVTDALIDSIVEDVNSLWSRSSGGNYTIEVGKERITKRQVKEALSK